MSLKRVYISRVVVSLLMGLLWILGVTGSLLAYYGTKTVLWGALPAEIALYVVLTVLFSMLTKKQNSMLIQSSSYRAFEKSINEMIHE